MTKLRTLRRSSRVAALVAAGAILSLCHVVTATGFTLIESQYVPAVQLVAGQAAAVKVSNVSADSVDLTVDIFSGNGTLLASNTMTLLAGHTVSLPYRNNTTGNQTVRAVVTLGTASATVSSMLTFDKVSGQVMAIARGLLLP